MFEQATKPEIGTEIDWFTQVTISLCPKTRESPADVIGRGRSLVDASLRPQRAVRPPVWPDRDALSPCAQGVSRALRIATMKPRPSIRQHKIVDFVH
jgi:hypothetical protein